eukprot:TRINITY_DN283_c0_g1_i1.p1 TRINITY_DN283_c0_g1~~TRINITY_DN283_c0_g1_i1.p1  ORF type:complete len:314 (+),score=45.01 TRINITY_DN283_c0_g1_i1:36-977(+)
MLRVLKRSLDWQFPISHVHLPFHYNGGSLRRMSANSDAMQNLNGFITSKQIDFGKRSADYAAMRPGPPESLYEKIVQRMSHEFKCSWDWKGKRILDIATGPGVMAIPMAQKGASVVGIDIAEGQIVQARIKAKELGVHDRCTFDVATAEETKQESGSFDVVVVSTAWHWFDHARAMQEIKRVLKPNGVLIITSFVFLAKRSKLAADTEALVVKYNPAYARFAGLDGLFPQQVDQVVVDGKFELVEQFCYDYPQPFTHEQWRGRIRTCNGVGSSVLTEEKIAQFDSELAQIMKDKYPAETQNVWHRVWTVMARI